MINQDVTHVAKLTKKKILSLQNETVSAQGELLKSSLDDWIKEAGERQIDDIVVVGVKF